MRNARNLWTVLFWFLAGLPVAVAGTAIGVHVVGGGGGGGGGGSGTVGPGTVNTMAKFTAADTVDDSTITDDGSLVTVANALVCQKPVDSTTAYQFKNAAGTTVLDVDTTNGRVGVNTTPQTDLHVYNTATGNHALYLEGNQANAQQSVSVYINEGGGNTVDTTLRSTGSTLSGAGASFGSSDLYSTLWTSNFAGTYLTNGKMKVGTLTANPLILGTGNVEAMRLHTSQNLSIGTTSDLGALAVDNGATAESILVLRDNGTAVVTVADSGQIQSQTGSAGAPSYSFDGDTNTGMYRSSADLLSFATNGVARLQLNTTGLTNADTSVTCGQLTGTVCVNDTLGVESSLSTGHAVASIKATSTAGLSGFAAYDSGGTRRLDVGYGNSSHTVAPSEAFLRTPDSGNLFFYNNTTKAAAVRADGFRIVAQITSLPTCDSAAAGAMVLYSKSAGAEISMCVCERHASTYAWNAATAAGDCT